MLPSPTANPTDAITNAKRLDQWALLDAAPAMDKSLSFGYRLGSRLLVTGLPVNSDDQCEMIIKFL
jgi:hypothetical protein